MTTSTTISTIVCASITWNGGHCQTCGANYLGSHYCTREDIIRKIGELSRLLDTINQPRQVDQTRGCPCRPENGGSGLCGCILGGLKVT